MCVIRLRACTVAVALTLLAMADGGSTHCGSENSVLPSAGREDVAVLRDYVEHFAYHPYQLWHKGGVLVSTFAGQDSLFGFRSLHEAWTFVKDALQEIAPVSPISRYLDVTKRCC